MFRGERRLSILGQVNNINQQNFSSEDLLGVLGDNSSRGSGGRKGGRGPSSGGRPSFLSGFSAGGSASDFRVGSSGGITETIAGGLNYQDNWGKKIDISSSYFYNQGINDAVNRSFQNYYIDNSSGQQYEETDSNAMQSVTGDTRSHFGFGTALRPSSTPSTRILTLHPWPNELCTSPSACQTGGRECTWTTSSIR